MVGRPQADRAGPPEPLCQCMAGHAPWRGTFWRPGSPSWTRPAAGPARRHRDGTPEFLSRIPRRMMPRHFADFRSVFHDQGKGAGDGFGAGLGIRHHQEPRRDHRGLQRCRPRHDLHHSPAGFPSEGSAGECPRGAPHQRIGDRSSGCNEALIIEVGRAMLEKLGYRVLVAQGGDKAVETVSEKGERIDLVLLDMVMPGLDGGATFDIIRSIDRISPSSCAAATPSAAGRRIFCRGGARGSSRSRSPFSSCLNRSGRL